MLNATHKDWTRANIRHGLEISRLTGGKHFIINTAENGRGPIHKRLPNGRRLTVWCNPPQPRPRPGPDHEHVEPEGRRLPVDQPPRLCPGVPGPFDRVVRAARAQLREVRDPLGVTAARHEERLPSPPLGHQLHGLVDLCPQVGA